MYMQATIVSVKKCVYIYICIYTYICVYIHTYTCIDIILSPWSVSCMYIFRADHLVLDNQPVCSSMGKKLLPALSTSLLLLFFVWG